MLIVTDERYVKAQLPYLLMEQIDKRYLIPSIQLNQQEMIGKGTYDLIYQPHVAF